HGAAPGGYLEGLRVGHDYQLHDQPTQVCPLEKLIKLSRKRDWTLSAGFTMVLGMGARCSRKPI
ncbi:MAG: hypothetical protein ABL893_19905, partial [Hyphomicrobium sp.]